MRKIRSIYKEIVSIENLYRSAYMAAKGRRYRDTTADFNFHLEDELQRLQEELEMKTYRHGEYRVFTIRDPKVREIAAAPFRDRVVHHAVHDVIEPLMDKSFIYHSYACRKGKGTHRAVDTAQSFLRANRFCFHGDVRKYFPSIDHGILKGLVERRVEDKDLLWLSNEIIDSARQLTVPLPSLRATPNEVRGSEAISRERLLRRPDFVGAPRNDVVSACGEPKGLPIGNLTSQFFANLYLNELDYFVKFDLKCPYYIRYMDDFLIFDNDKGLLQEVKNRIREFLRDRLNISLHEGKSQVYRTKKGIKFLGFRLFKEHRRLATDNVRRFRKRLERLLRPFGLPRNDVFSRHCEPERSEGEAISREKIRASVRCWVAHAKYANTVGLRRNIVNRLAICDKQCAISDMVRGEML